MAYPARMISLILSDVVGDRLETIASGITVPDPTTFHQALDILTKYHIEDKVPPAVKRMIESGTKGLISETPKSGDPAFENVENILIGNNLMACRAAKFHGEKLGYITKVLSTTLTGEAREIARSFSSLARDIDSGRSNFGKPALLIAGGETTVTVRGNGKGGRNQEMALAFLCDLIDFFPEFKNISFLSAGTDGIDGPTDAAGAFVTHDLKEKMDKLRLKPHEYLENNDSYPFFEATGHLLKTGPTNTNVCDIQILIVT
jgi:glycerate 2-kinase